MILLPEVIENCLKFWNMIEVKEFGLLLRSVYKVLVSISHFTRTFVRAVERVLS